MRRDLAQGLRHSATAVEKARARDGLWLRHVLFDRCRIAAKAGRIEVIEEAMAAALETLPIDMEAPDTPFLEYDWLKQLPDGLVDPDLVARYMRAAKENGGRLKKNYPELIRDDG